MSTAKQEIIPANEIIIPSEENTVARVEPKAKEANNAVMMANDIVIDCHEMAEFASDFLSKVKTANAAAEVDRKSITGPINDSLKIINAKYKPVTTLLGKAETIIKDKLKAFSDEQKRLAEEKRVAAQKKIDDARKKAEAEAAKKKAEADAAAAKATKSGDEQAIADAEAAQEQAEDAQDHAEALEHTAPVVAAPAQKVAGISKRKNWKAEVTDLMELVKAVAEGKVPLSCIKADESALNKMAKAMESEMNYPGVRAYNDAVIASR